MECNKSLLEGVFWVVICLFVSVFVLFCFVFWFSFFLFYHSSRILGVIVLEDDACIFVLDRLRLWGKVEREVKTGSQRGDCFNGPEEPDNG